MKKLNGFIDNNIKEDCISVRIVLCIFLIKLVYLVFFVACHHIYIQNDIQGLFVSTGDTGSYFSALENWLRGGSLGTIERMPGIYPIYAPLYILGGHFFASNALVIIQFIVSVISVVVLGKVSLYIFNKPQVAFFVMFLYTISSFVSNFDIMGMMDSLSVSTLIFGVYFYVSFRKKRTILLLLFSGFFLTWSFFFREVGIFAIVIIGLSLLINEIKST